MTKKIDKRLWRIDQVSYWRLCMGCGACSWVCPNEAISLENIIDKGIRPFINENRCKKCGKCVEVCPGLKLISNEIPSDIIEMLKSSWGPILKLFEGYSSDSNIRFKSSSGGVATAIALWAIENGKFVGILHIKKDPNNPLYNVSTFSKERDDILQTVGSRYAPVASSGAFNLITNANGPCVFIGKPCDCAALRKACQMDTGLSSKVGLIVSIFCAGTPSTSGTFEIINKMGIDDHEQLEDFRYRGYGWPGRAKAKLINKKKLSMTYDKAWGEILTKHVQLRCRLCPDKTGEFADIALGDPWYRETQGDSGRSIILIRSVNGSKIWNKIKDSGYIEYETLAWNRLPESQVSLHQGRRELFGRLLAFKLMGIPYPKYSGFSLYSNWKELNMKAKFISIAGTIRRILKRKWCIKENIKRKL